MGRRSSLREPFLRQGKLAHKRRVREKGRVALLGRAGCVRNDVVRRAAYAGTLRGSGQAKGPIPSKISSMMKMKRQDAVMDALPFVLFVLNFSIVGVDWDSGHSGLFADGQLQA